MTRDPIRVAVTCPVGRVVRLMESQRIRHVLVMDGERLAGIVSSRDVRAPLVVADPSRPPLSASSPVSEAMSEVVVTASPSTPLTNAAREMLDQKIGALPVLEEGRPVGILTKSDALEALVAWAERSRSA
jgi:CBS domain-containing protein